MMFHAKYKHIELDLYYVREKVQRKEIFYSHIPSNSQVPNIMTKPLSRICFSNLRNKLKVKEPKEAMDECMNGTNIHYLKNIYMRQIFLSLTMENFISNRSEMDLDTETVMSQM